MIAFLCGDLGRHAPPLDVEGVAARMSARCPGLEARVVPGPCGSPERWLDDRGGASDGPVVLGLCTLGADRRRLETALRRQRIDPSGVVRVDLGAACRGGAAGATERAARLLAGALARVRAWAPPRPESLKTVLAWDGSLSRRALFTVPPVRYELVPAIRREECASRDGCRVCASTCPHRALSAGAGGRMVLDKTRCTGCGACVSACPRAAIDLPGASLTEIDAQVEALLDGPSGSARIAFACERMIGWLGTNGDAGWLPVEVPCAGIVAPGWLLHSLARGAAAVGVLPCGEATCRFGHPDVVRGRVDYCRRLLQEMGQSPERVRLLGLADEPRSAEARPVDAWSPVDGAGAAPAPSSPFTHEGTARAVLALAAVQQGRPAGTVAHLQSPFGVVDVRDGCTGCGACAQACPTGSLVLERDRDGLALTCEAGRCVACAQCVPVCPEGVLTMTKATDLERLARGRFGLQRSDEVRCVSCGGPVAPKQMIERIQRLLGDDPSAEAIARHCVACRGQVVPAAGRPEETAPSGR